MRYIFRLCAAGMGPEQIAKRLERERVLVPTEYAYRKFGRSHSSRNPDFPYRWSDSSIAHILENMDYIGVQVSCKTHKPSYKSDLVVEVPEEERYTVENAHEPIIDRELWDIVQRVRENKRRPTKLGKMDMLAGMVQCADCGSTHYLCRCGSWDESKYTYVCGKYHRHKEECTPHTVKGPAPAGSCFTSDTDRRTNGTSRPGSLHRPFDSQTIRPVEKGTDSQAEGTGAG